MNNILKISEYLCCGCGVCVKKCPKAVLELQEDQEGFLYPRMLDPSLCINCGICLNHCPVYNRQNSHPVSYEAPQYAYHPDPETCRASASGGVAASLYRSVIGKNGVGFGVSYTGDFTDAEYIMVEDMDSLYMLCGSKYIKARENDLYESVRQQLQQERMVLVIGLPCEIAALNSFLGKEYANLYTCELICHGPTSHIVLEQYIKQIQHCEGSQVVALNQRAKLPYWKPYYVEIGLDNGTKISRPFTDSDFEKAFQIMKRPSCNSCGFKDGKTCSDMIIGDFHGAKKQTEEFHEYGVSICLPCTEKGMELIEMLKADGLTVGKANQSRARGNRALHEPIPRMQSRRTFVKKLLTNGLHKAANDPLIKFDLKKRKILKRLKNRLKFLNKSKHK